MPLVVAIVALYFVSSPCLSEECLQNIYLEPVARSTCAEPRVIGATHAAMPITAEHCKTPYQNIRLSSVRKALQLAGTCAPLCRLNDGEPTVFSSVEAVERGHIIEMIKDNVDALLLSSLDLHEHVRKPVDALLERASVVRDLARLHGQVAPWFRFDHNVKVDELFGERAHIVLEADFVFANAVRCEHEVALTFALSGEQDTAVRVLDFKVNIK